MRKYPDLLLPFLLLLASTPMVRAQELQPRVDGSLLRIAAPQLHFLSGGFLEKLRNGAAVAFVFQLSASSSGDTVSETRVRYILSYDLWEERFSIVQTDTDKRSASHLDLLAAEAWCLENLSLPLSGLAREKSFILKLEIRGELSRDKTAASGSSFSISALVEVFSRKGREEPARWTAASGPVQMSELMQKKPNQKSQILKP